MDWINTLICVGLMATTACSSSGTTDPADAAEDPVGLLAPGDEDASDDPTAQLCARWTSFESLTDSDVPPSDEFVAQVLESQREVEEVLPADLSSSWSDITAWNGAFIEYLSTTGYRELDDDDVITIFGDEDAVEAAAASLEAGYAAMREWSAHNCTTGGDATTFCTAWTDISALLAEFDGEAPTEGVTDQLVAANNETSPDVPAEVREDWNAIFDYVLPYRDVLITVEYDTSRASDDLLAEAFGSIDDFDELQRAAAEGRTSIDAWSLDGCGDFCFRWGETSEALGQLRDDLQWVVEMGDDGLQQLEMLRTRLAIADRQLPDELRSDWDLLMDLLDDWYAWWEAVGFDQQRFIGPDGMAAGAEIARDAVYLPELLMEVEGHATLDQAVVDLELRSDDELAATWEHALQETIQSRMERLAEWTEEGCGSAGGQPGRLRVTWPTIEGSAGSELVLAVMPPGAEIEAVGDVATQQAAYCQQIGADPWRAGESDWFRSERPEDSPDSLCDLIDEAEAGPTMLDAGPHTLLAALVPGVRGSNLTGPPTACVALDIDIDGDTAVEIPPLPSCDADLSDVVIEIDEWGADDSIDPAMPGAGTLRVTIPALVLPDEVPEQHGGELWVVVLPSGTTLNDVGREEVWPSGGFHTVLEPRNEPHSEELRALGPIALPVVEFPPGGFFGQFDPWWLSEATNDQLPLVVLAPGDYDVYTEVIGYSDDGEEFRCGRTAVTIDGDTVIELPEWAEC